MLHCRYTYAALLVPGCCTFSARVLHFFWHYYSQVFTEAFLLVKSFDFRLILIVPWQDKGDCRRILQVGSTCFPLGNVFMQYCSMSHGNLNHSSRKRSRLQIRFESIYISKNKGQKNPCKRLRCICDNPWAFFDLSSVAAGLQSAMQQYYLPTIYIITRW